jgi:hypothetical protein
MYSRLAEGEVFLNDSGMEAGIQNTVLPTFAAQWDADLIFPVLADRVRRQLLIALARQGGQSATALCGAAHRRLDCTLKHLTAMRSAGLVVMKPDTQDRRRQLYSLTASVPLMKTPDGMVIDFGFCLIRL